MAGETSSPNMGMPVPGVGITAGPQWASDIVSCLSILDSHTHALGSGVPITPSGMNINADLGFGNNSALALLKATFTSQTSALTGTNFVSFISGNLYVNDGSGNQIQMTSGGGVAGSPGSIGSLSSPAAATYASGSKTFIWTAASTKAAAMDNGAITIRETNVASAKGITIASPTSLASDYSMTLPASLPGSTLLLTLSSAGAIATVSNASIADTIGQAMTATGSNALVATVTSSTAADNIASHISSTGADAIGSLMTATGSNAIGSVMTATGSNPLVNSISSGVAADHVAHLSSLGTLTHITSLTTTAFTGSFVTLGSFTVPADGIYLIFACGVVAFSGSATVEVRISTSPTLVGPTLNFPGSGNSLPFNIMSAHSLTAGDTVAIQGRNAAGSGGSFSSAGELGALLLKP